MHRNITFRRLALDFYQDIRSQKALTRVLGFQYVRSLKYTEIDVTYRCNLKCRNCNRSCTQAPSNQDLPLESISLFIEESMSSGIKWERLRLLGGEPALHPELPKLAEMLLAYKYATHPEMRIVLCTNGTGPRVNAVLSQLPKGIDIKSTSKGRQQRLFRPFNMAPIDNGRFRFADYHAGCRIISDCGLGLTPMGYYPCAIAGGIDRVLGLDLGRKHLPAPSDDMRDQMDIFCRYCGFFGFLWPAKQQKTSPAWENAYYRYRKGVKARTKEESYSKISNDLNKSGKL
jgi:hypothetical protein